MKLFTKEALMKAVENWKAGENQQGVITPANHPTISEEYMRMKYGVNLKKEDRK